MASPVQVVVNPSNFHQDREKGGGGSRTDFFAFQDAEFVAHRNKLVSTLNTCASALITQSQVHGEIGYLKIILRRSAWAKSHRPLRALFKQGETPCVGGLDLGQILVEVTPDRLRDVAADMLKAEPHTKLKTNPRTGKDEPNPSGYRSEVGAIERIELYGPADKRRFDIEPAIGWLSQSETGQSYEVELFSTPPPIGQRDSLDLAHRKLFQSFRDGLKALGGGINLQRISGLKDRELPRLSLRIEQTSLPANIQLLPAPTDRSRSVGPFNPSSSRHAQVLKFLENHPLVRSIQLPGKIGRSASQSRTRPGSVKLSLRDKSRSYPRVGVIDGGVAPFADDWVIGRWTVLDDSHVDTEHGTFISGLLIAGSALNGADVLSEPDGVEIYDARVFPQEAAFGSYYLTLDDFFNEVENAIIAARNQHGIRVFNLSMNVTTPVSSDTYSRWAARLDQIADDHDVIIFISAGNLEDHRPEWPVKNEHALAMLASNQNDTIFTPAESARNASVAAVNPPGCASAIEHAPARYSRRGPGLKSLVKPDYAHVGGSGSPQAPLGHGLFSISPAGGILDACGTSYATPLVAKTAARLDTLVEGGLSRETMLAMLTHHAKRPKSLAHKVFDPVARQLIGHGLPPDAASMLEGNDNEVTLVFATRLPRDKQLIFPFSWPPSLSQSGNCRGDVRLTLFASPPLDARFGAEFVRINIDAALQQEKEDGGWEGRLRSAYLPAASDDFPIEAERIEHGYKWSPMKVYETSRRGVGKTSNWRLVVNYLTRFGERMPETGIPFTAVLTIRDPKGAAPVFNEMRQYLSAQAIRTEDIRTAARVVARV